MTHLVPFALSAALMTFSLVLFRWTSPPLPLRLLYSLKIFLCVVLYSFYFVANYFTGEGITSSVIYHLRYGLEGAGFGSYIDVIVLTIAFLTLGLLLSAYAFYSNGIKCKYRASLSVLLLLSSLTLNPASLDLYNLTFGQKESSHRFTDYYANGSLQATSDEHPNFVFIYAESLERTYFDEALFPGLINELKELEKESTSFTDILQPPGSEWTMGGMVSSQCGIPLVTPSGGNSMAGMDAFLPDATCLGDLLSEEGYELTYMGGASLDFGGKGKLYASHGYAKTYGKEELLPQLANPSYLNTWGLHDDTLFDLAFQRFTELSRSGKRFGLTMVTLATHHPTGYSCASTEHIQYGDGSDTMRNAIASSDHLISNFVNKIRESKYGKNTVIIVASDHLAFRVSTHEQLKQGKRRNLFMVIDPKDSTAREISNTGTTFDVGATILHFLGYRGAIGLGRNLLEENSLETELNGLSNHLPSWRDAITDLWNFPQIFDYVEIDPFGGRLLIGQRSFEGPLIAELGNDLETTFKFEHSSFRGDKMLIDYALEIEPGNAFMWLDSCSKLNQYLGTRYYDPVCLMVGRIGNLASESSKKDFIGEVIPIRSNRKFSADWIKKTINQ